MTIALIGNTTGTAAEVETSTRALRIVEYPPGNYFRGSYSLGRNYNFSAGATGIAAASTFEILSFWNTKSTVSILKKASISFGFAAPTAQGQLTFQLFKSKENSGIPINNDGAATPIAVTILNSIPNLRSSQPDSSAIVAECFNVGGATTTVSLNAANAGNFISSQNTVLTQNIRLLETVPFASITTSGLQTNNMLTNVVSSARLLPLWDNETSVFPFIMEPNDGFSFQMKTGTFTITSTVNLSVNFVWDEYWSY